VAQDARLHKGRVQDNGKGERLATQLLLLPIRPVRSENGIFLNGKVTNNQRKEIRGIL
jgi:hypothetical protein